jgi:P-loop containing NTP hydrolase pore-1/C-terminal domain on Strawberry notch homologue
MTAQLALFDIQSALVRPYATNLMEVARLIAIQLSSHQKLTGKQLQSWMNREFNGTAAQGAWTWKDCYEAQEAALVFLLKERGQTWLKQSPQEVLQHLAELESLTLTHTKRTEETIALQQFSTPLPLAYLTALCAQITAQDLVLEPSAGTGLLARWAEVAGAQLVLNELSDRRTSLLRKLFPGKPVYSFNAEQIHDYLPATIQPTVVLMNPPFSASPNIDQRHPEATVNHIRSAFLRLAPGGRLVVISAAGFSPSSTLWRRLFAGLKDAIVHLTVQVTGDAYLKHGTSIDTRLTVIDKQNRDSSLSSRQTQMFLLQVEGASDSMNSLCLSDVQAILEAVPPRSQTEYQSVQPTVAIARTRSTPRALRDSRKSSSQPQIQSAPEWENVIELTYEISEPNSPQSSLSDAIYEVYQPRRIRIVEAHPHPTTLCESAALASVMPPIPHYQPYLPQKVVAHSLLSEAQLESIIYAGEAHAHFLRGHYQVEEHLDVVSAAAATDANAVQFRRGWFLGDGTGAGKGRQLAGIILDNWLQGRRRSLWISKSDKLIEDARRDWCALGGDAADMVSLSKYKQGTPIPLTQGILFTTYATLRSAEKPDKPSRLQQIIDWLGADFEGVIAFDEAHAMGNASSEKAERGVKAASQQGIVGLRLQNALPQARVVYVSATGATKVSNLAYASRLGLWQTGDFPFANQTEFIQSIEAGGVAVMEVVCRDLKALGLYFARNLSFDGVEYEALEVELAIEQIAIYDQYAEAFQVIHTHLEDALTACNVTSSAGKSLNRNAKMVAKSAFESSKQRFFSHLLTSMKCADLIKAIAQDLEAGRAAVIQIVSTNEEMMKRRLAELPVEEWADLNIDITPREYVMDYLVHAFPIRLYAVYSDADGNLYSEPVSDAQGEPVYSREAIAQRDELVTRLTSLPPLPSALDQLLHHFGQEAIAEVTGRSQRILKDTDEQRLYVSNRAANANLAETQAFMDDEKQILIFSDAGGTGRSYHADLGAKNTRRRVHYLLEAGWRADNAIQGLGRSHRTNQASAPIFRPVVTTVRGERRFISTIARRLDTLGALTRGQRQTGGQGLFDAKDNLESHYAEAALTQFFRLIYRGEVAGCGVAQFQTATGLNLMTEEGHLKEELPGIPQFLNRMLALPIHLQNQLFEVFEMLIDQNVEGAIASGIYDMGVETLTADHLRVLSRNVVYTHDTGGETLCLEMERLNHNVVLSADEAWLKYQAQGGKLCFNQRSQRGAIAIPTTSTVNDAGVVLGRVSLIRPGEKTKMTLEEFRKSQWVEVSFDAWARAWAVEAADTPAFVSDRFFLVCGLLLPIWQTLDSHSMRVYRLQTDEGERLLGRLVEPQQMAKLATSLGLQKVKLTGAELYNLVMTQRQSYPLAGGLSFRAATVMGEVRLEVAGTISAALGAQLKTVGCFSEIIEWRSRYFVPVGAKAPEMMEQICRLTR